MKKLLNKLNFKKSVAVFTSITFIFTGVLGNSAFASIGSSMPAINTIHFDTPIIPTSLGKITSAKYFDSEDIIINIQDLHCHAETQRKIASIIGYIDNTYNLNNVYLEGAFKTVDTSWLSSFNNNKNGTKVLEGLIDSGKLSGTEYYSIMNNKKDFVLGIEDEALYKENIKLLGAIISLQPEVNAICSQLEKEINKIKRDYSSRQARKLERLIKSFKQKEIDAKHYYEQLTILANSCNLSINKYPNIKLYISLLNKAQYINNKKVIHEFSKFVAELKNVLPYQQYSDLIKKSNNFNNLDDITMELIALDKQYSITNKLKLTNFEKFLTYLEFNHNINPIKLIKEEEGFISELYVKLGRTKYEKEVAFLFEFIPTIKQYFTADISADEYYKFEKNYELFKTVWPSYFSENTVKNLEQYQKLLSKYHKNNITRDQIFANSLISKKNINNNVYVSDTNLAIKQIKTNLNNKKIKLVVTGGFHTRGLEKIFEQQKISYVIITPKITQPIEQAKQIYIDNVMYYSNILKNTINLEPLTQEPLNVSFPKILNLVFSEIQNNSIFEEYSKQDMKQAVKQFIQEYIIAKQSSFYGQVEILNWDIMSDDLTGKIEFFVEYRDNANKATVSNVKYQFVDGNVIPYSSVDVGRTKNMLERITNNKYAQPSIELEPTNATRKKIAKHIFEPLQKVIGNAISLMPFEQLHMTIGYDSTPMTQQDIDTLVQEGDTSVEIFSVLDILGQDFVNFRTSMAGTLKLMPDGVIIYEITDKDLIEKMLGFRTVLKGVDAKYKTPSIVHMTIGRISDMRLLDGSEQSNQELAEILKKINETIYEINKKNALSKIKTTFTLKSGYVSSTGDKDFVFRRILPQKESLVVFKNLVDNSKAKLSFVYKVIVAPLIEEFLFRFVPFFVAGLFVSSPMSIVPVIVTGIIGILGFSFAHPLTDRINNYFYSKNEIIETKSDFISRVFREQLSVRNVRDFIFPSTGLTAIFVAAAFIFPQGAFAAFVITSLLHSLNNFVAEKIGKKGLLLTIKQDSSSQDKKLDFEINQIIEMFREIARNKTLPFRQERNSFVEAFENIGEDKDAIKQKVIELFEFVADNHKKSNSFDLIFLLEPVLNISIYLKEDNGNLLFDRVFDYILKQAMDSKNGSSRYFEILTDSAKYFYRTGQIDYVHKILDSLYKNKGSVASMMDYKRFALPLPSPFSSDFSSVKEWEDEIYKMMMEDGGIFPNWYLPILEILVSSFSTEHKLDEYAKAYIRALYKSGKQKDVPRIRNIDEYEWNKAFYEACGIKQEDDEADIPKSEPLLNEENISMFADNAEILKTNNLYLSDIISRLKYLKQAISLNETLQSDQYSQIIEKLTDALSLTKQKQMDVITEQMNELVNLFLAEDCFKETKILEMLIPVLVFVKSNKTSQSLLSVVALEVLLGKTFYEESLFNIVSFIYGINRQEALFLISKIFGEFRKRDMFGANWEYWRPKTLQEAYEKVPAYLKNIIKTYEDLELFYYTIGIEFDSIEKDSLLYERREYVPEYQLLLDKLPVSIFEQTQQQKKYFRTLKKEIASTQKTSEDSEKLSMYFEALEKVLDNNILALSEINKANKDAMDDAFLFVEEMINGFELLNETAAAKARLSLQRIKENFSDSKTTVAELVRLRGWTVKDMDKITELHTLINAVHQTAINSLMSKLKYSNLGSQCVFKENYEECFSFFDCSTTKISKQMEDFIAYLKLGFFLSKKIKVVAKGNKLIYSKSLGAHSVDVMVDLDEGIRVTFNDSGRGDGNAMRVLLLASLFAQAGFDITNLDANTDTNDGICNFTAMCSLPKGALNNGVEYAKYFEQALTILGDTKDLDFQLEGRDEDGDKHSYGEYIIPAYNLERINKLKNSPNMPEEFTFATMPEERFKEKQTNNPSRSKILSPVLGRQWTVMSQVLTNLKKRVEQNAQALDSVYDYLSIKEKSKRNVWEIVSEYVKGKLIINKDGVLEINEDYDGIDILLDAIEANVDDSSRQSQVINLLDYSELNFETEGYIGGMVALSGSLRLDDKGWLSIKVAVDKERKRAKFAYVEFVDFNGTRKPLDYGELITKLREFGYTVKDQKPRSSLEIKEALTVLKERILFPKDGIYTRGMSVSGQADKYVPVKITYDKNKVDENSMWVVSYTTPEDVATIINAGAIMTTTGGMLSHANITARENKKTAILSNGQWIDGRLVVPYYSIESPIEQKRNYEIQKISEHRLVLEEGAVALANGINGRVLVYKDIPEQTISEIQKAIDENDINFIMDYIQDHYQDKNIRQVVEYIFLQVITDKNKQKIIEFFLAWDKKSAIGKKVSELVKVYTGEKIKALKIYIGNERKIKDANIRLAIINFIKQELDVLQYSLTSDDVVNEMQQLMGIVNRDKDYILSQRAKEVRKIIRQANIILTKDSISEQDKDELIKISERAKVWDFFGSSEIRDLVNKIDKIISLEIGKDYETEIRDFEDIRAKDVVRYGTKTTELAKLFKLFKDSRIKVATVPHGVGLSKDVLRIFFEQNGLADKYSTLIENFQQAIKSKNKKEAIKIGREISKLIESINDEQLDAYLKSKLDDGKKYAVRSSGVGEDGANHAFAGMAKTALNVDKKDVYTKVKEGWKSFFTDACIEDMVKVGIVVQPALLVQEMVAGVEKAGVMFTRDNTGNLTIEGVLGLGEGLVSGRITPDHMIVRASDGRIEYRRALNNMIKIEEKPQGGTRVAKITAEERIERILDEEKIRQLQKIADILEEDAGYPVDIEFAIDKDGKIFVLQRRAITTLTQQEEIEDTKDSDSVILEQSFIDEVIEMLSTLLIFDEIKEIVDKLSNLPEDINEKYDVTIEQVKALIKFLKKNHKKDYNMQVLLEDRYGRYYDEDSILGKLRKLCLENNLIRSFDSDVYLSKVVIYILTSFLTLVDVNNAGNLLFYSIIDSLFTDEYGEDRDGKTVLSEMANIINFTYSINPNFVPYIVNKLLDKNLISVDENAPYEIRSGLKDNYEAQKYYYFALSAKDKVNNNMSDNLLKNVSKLRDIISLIENEDIRQDMNKILFNLDELIDKINNKNIVLLEMQLNLLLEKVKILKDTNKEVAFKIVDVILSICEQGVKENKDLNAVNLKIYDLLYSLLIDEFDNNTDHTLFNNVISKLNLLIQPQNNDKNIGEFKTFNAEVVKILLNVALHIYEPISSHKLDDKNSREYKNREQLCLDIFRNLSVKRVTDTYIYSCLFNKNDRGISGIGFTPAALDILIDAAKQNNCILPIPSTTDNLIDENIELLANMVVDSIEYINPINMFTSSFYKELNEDSWFSSKTENKEKMKRFSCLVMEKLLSVAKDNNVDLAKRKRAVIILLETISSGIYKNNIKDVSIDFEEVKLLAEKLNIPVFIYLGDASIKHGDGHVEYSFTPLIRFIPKSILEKFSLPLLDRKLKAGEEASTVLLRNKKPIITKISGKTNPSVAEVQQVLIRFSILQKIMEYNKSVLLLLDKLNDSKNYNKNLAELLNELQSMINELKKINIEHGNAAQEALDNIVIDLNDNTVDRKTKVRNHLLLSAWTKWEIKNIKEIHTLINAVHQISIADFKKEIGDISKIGAPIQVITAHQESTIEGYNLSDTINSNIIKFLSKLATRKVPKSSINDFICKDDLVVWTTNLNQHSVDIFFNFGEADRGISIYYKEIPDHSYERGKKERVRYFKEILEYLGFYVEIDTEKYNGLDSYSIKATLNKDYGMNETMDLIDIATQVVEIFKYSSNIDCDFEARHYESGFEEVYKRWVTKAKRRESWYGVEISNQGKFYGYGNNGYKLDLLPKKRSLKAEYLNDILSYLGCDLLPINVTREDLFDPIYLDKYFNKPIERAFVEGRIKFNQEGFLVEDRRYDLVHSMIDELNTNFTEISKQARVINLVNTYEFDTRMLAYIGNFVVVSSIMELKNGDRLFIKAIMDPNTKRMKYAIAEKVTDSTREKLTSDELIKILGKEGYVISEQEWVDSREIKRTRRLLSRKIQTIESPKIPSTPTSDGTGVSVVGNITFDKNNVDENSILIVPYTTPDDMRFIETAKGIITTGGGVLSHAAITTRELKKPSVVLNGATWTNNEIEILYYLASGEPETINNQFQVQKVKATRKTLKEGSRVLINGETGAVLLFDDIDISLLDELQSYIDADDAQAIIDFMNNHSKNKSINGLDGLQEYIDSDNVDSTDNRSKNENINRLVEYIYFQVVGNSKTTQTLDCLFSSDMPEIVQDKVKELNDGYIQDKVQSISEAILNLMTIDNVNIAYMVLQELNKKLAFIKTVGTRTEIEGLKEQLRYIEKGIKEKLNVYMQDFINDLLILLSKDKLNSSDIQDIITMLKNIEIYNYFVSDNETMKELLSKKDTLQVLVPMLRDKVNGYTEQKQDINLQEEISLFEKNASDEKLFGSKTAQLANMYELLKNITGVIVPGGIGISVNVMPMLFKSLGKENVLTAFENAIKNKDKQRAMEIAKEICNLIDSEQLKGTELEKEILKQLQKFIKPGQKYSVRSSGVGEDATNNAFAGMGETKLNVGYDDIYDNVRECWKSFFSERCIDYMISSGQVVKPAVLVEEMVDSEISGVAFSRDKYGNGRINALFGQGEGLVSGMLDPDSILFDMSSGEIIEYLVANKQFKLVTDAEGGIKKVAVGQNAKSRALNAKNVKKLAEIIKLLENEAGYPIDVEFAIKGNEIYILQMRPITTLDNKEKSKDIEKGADSSVDVDMQVIPFAETKYEISVTLGKISKEQEPFVYIANPSDPTQAIPVYKKSADKNVTEFIVDSKYADIVKSGMLGKLLLDRINSDPVILAKLNAGIFNFRSGEIGLLPILDEDIIEKSLSDSTIDIGIENIRNILASA